MKRVVISSDLNRLSKFLRDDKDEYFYISLEASLTGPEDFLIGKGCAKVSVQDGLGAMDFKKEYIDFIGGLSRHYNSMYWWATTASYKGTFASNLRRDVFNYYCLISLIKKQDRNYIIISNDGFLNKAVKTYCMGNGIECALLDGIPGKDRISYIRKYFMSCVYFLFDGWARKALAFFYLSGAIKKSIRKGDSYYMIRTWIDNRSFPRIGEYEDLYFGSLSGHLKEKGYKVIVLAGILTDYRGLVSKIKKAKGDLIIPQEYFAGYLDYLKVIALGFLNRPKIAASVMFCGLEVTGLLEESLERDYEYNEINKNLMYYYYAKGLLKKLSVDVFLYPFENQSWEKMSIIAFRKFSKTSRIMGYAHSSLRPYLFGYFHSKEEEEIVPLPDRIITLGRGHEDILRKSGGCGAEARLRTGCALRYQGVFNKPGEKSWNRNGKILVALSMDIGYSSKLLRFLHNGLSERDRGRITLRPHPFTPREAIRDGYGDRLAREFSYSPQGKNFQDDLKDSSALIYVDSNCSAEALISGVPVIHVDFKEDVSADPLLDVDSLKWTVSYKDSLSMAIEHIRAMKEDEYMEKYKRAEEYLRNYFYPVTKERLDSFI